MKKLLFLSLVTAVFFTACGHDEVLGPTTTVNLNFKAVYDGKPLVSISDKYLYPDGKQVKFQVFNFFISDVVLIEDAGADEAGLVDIEFVDFSENTTLAEAETPVTFTKQRVPAGNYKGIKIGIGVPADLNTASANQFGSGHPLRQNYDHFWSDWGSFIFMKLEGVYDKDANGFDGNDPGFGHHPGTNEVYRTVTLLKPIELKEGQPFDLNLVVDVLKLYEANDGSYLDLSDPANLYTHNPNDLTIANYLMDNFSQAIVLE